MRRQSHPMEDAWRISAISRYSYWIWLRPYAIRRPLHLCHWQTCRQEAVGQSISSTNCSGERESIRRNSINVKWSLQEYPEKLSKKGRQSGTKLLHCHHPPPVRHCEPRRGEAISHEIRR